MAQRYKKNNSYKFFVKFFILFSILQLSTFNFQLYLATRKIRPFIRDFRNIQNLILK